MKKLLSRWIAAIMVGVMVISSGVTGTVQAEGNHVETTEEKLQTDTEKNNSEIEGDLSVGDDATSQKEDDSVAEENNATESEIIEEGAVNEENVGKNPESTEVSEETEPEESEEIEMALNYLYINEAEQQEGEQQSIVLSWGNENTQVNNISLTLENENGEQTILEATKKSDELYLYEHIFSQGVYHVSNVHVATDESEKDFTAEELEIDAYFGVGKTPNESAKSSYIEMESVEEGEDSANTAASVETSVVSIGENGEETAEASIGAALEAQGVTAESGKARSARAKNVVVVLDPGHDSKHAGAYGNGVHEEVATLKIAKYCKEELEQYGGITVYMTRESAACPFPNSKDNIDDIKQRTAWAKTKGADVFVSFHLNSNNSSSPNGAEVYYPKTSSGGAALAQKIQGELVALGLKNRGTKANETLAVINSSMRNGFPGVLIEHAFVSNSSDANNYLNSDAKLKKLGVADAKGIASYFGLSKGKWVQDSKGWKYEVNGKYVISQWMTIGGEKYYFDAEGYRVIGWQTIRSQKYYFMPDGHMHMGWLSFGDTYYYMMPDGHMHTGWLSFGNTYYYMNQDGMRVTGWQTIAGQKYYFMPDGHRHTGWLSFGDTYYYMMPDGHMHTGWLSFGDTYYYLNKEGVRQTGWQIIDGKEYRFDGSGVCTAIKNGWGILGTRKYYFRDGEMQIGWQTIEGQKYYFMPDGHMHTGWLSFGDTYYYMMPDGHMYTGWLSFGDIYYYLNKEGIRQTGWQTIEGQKYYFMPDGHMHTGWLSFGDTYYYMMPDGHMHTGWQIIGGKEYYFGQNGICVENAKKNGWTITGNKRYYFRDGEMQIGWQTIEGQKYYFMPDGHMHAGWLSFGDTYYYMMPDGHMHTGWLSFGDTYYYLNKEGIRQTGWQTIEGKEYYFDKNGIRVNNVIKNGWTTIGAQKYYFRDGEMQIGWQTIEGQKYYFMPDGHMHAGWLSFGDTYYYMMPDGHMHTGWLSFGDTYYYLNKEGIRQTGWQTIEDQRYYFMPDAHMHIGWLSFGDTYYYMMPDGHMHTGWLSFGSTYYYMDKDGVRVTGWQTIDGKDYYFDSNGVRKDGYPIEGKSEVTISQMLKMYQKQNKLYPSQALAKGGAPTIEDFVNIVYQEASAEGIKAEVVFCQSMLETGWLQFGGDVKVEQFNFAGLGATGGGVAGADFSSYGKEGVRIGIRAQVQHLKCYANKKPLINPCVDPRWGEWLRGKAPYVEWLGIKENPYGTGWAAGANYGNNIVKLIKST